MKNSEIMRIQEYVLVIHRAQVTTLADMEEYQDADEEYLEALAAGLVLKHLEDNEKYSKSELLVAFMVMSGPFIYDWPEMVIEGYEGK